MPSGVVFVAILVIWAVILAPRVMRLYERTATQRTTKRFSSAMTVLGSGKSVARVAVDTARRGSRVVVDTRGPSINAHTNRPRRVVAAGGVARPSRAVIRRRRVVALCVGVVGLAALAALVGVLPWIAVPLAGLPLALFLGACATSAARRREERTTAAAEQPVLAANLGQAGAASPGLAHDSRSDGAIRLNARRARRPGLRAGNWTQARVLEANLAIAATYSSTEEELGLDRYVASPSGVDGEPYLRAANE